VRGGAAERRAIDSQWGRTISGYGPVADGYLISSLVFAMASLFRESCGLAQAGGWGFLGTGFFGAPSHGFRNAEFNFWGGGILWWALDGCFYRVRLISWNDRRFLHLRRGAHSGRALPKTVLERWGFSAGAVAGVGWARLGGARRAKAGTDGAGAAVEEVRRYCGAERAAKVTWPADRGQVTYQEVKNSWA